MPWKNPKLVKNHLRRMGLGISWIFGFLDFSGFLRFFGIFLNFLESLRFIGYFLEFWDYLDLLGLMGFSGFFRIYGFSEIFRDFFWISYF